MSSQITVTTEALRNLHRIHRQLSDLAGRRIAALASPRAFRQFGPIGRPTRETQKKAHSLKAAVDDKQMQLKTRIAAADKREAAVARSEEQQKKTRPSRNRSTPTRRPMMCLKRKSWK